MLLGYLRLCHFYSRNTMSFCAAEYLSPAPCLVTSRGWRKGGYGGRIHTIETGKCYKPGLVPLGSQLLHCPAHTAPKVSVGEHPRKLKCFTNSPRKSRQRSRTKGGGCSTWRQRKGRLRGGHQPCTPGRSSINTWLIN